MDTISPQQRSGVMRRVRSKNTKPEMTVRRLTHAMGYRYRLHVNSLPGKPDLVFSRRKKVIFVHGCMWHGHEGCSNNRRPSTRTDYWNPKLDGNKSRDNLNVQMLCEAGWQVLIIWECEVKKDVKAMSKRISDFLEQS
jgi:DNA mismatch endonuclease (patch repair protein)